LESFTYSERKKLSELNAKNLQNLTENYILTLLANSNLGPDDEQKESRFSHVAKAFHKLNEIPEIKILLQLTATFKNFQIIFDFNRDHVQFLDPRAESYTNGLFYVNGRIYVGAKYLLDEERAHEVSFEYLI
jgi:hypothetical protein